MSILVIADVHANLAALEAVLADAGSLSEVEAIWALGDIVGYGPEPGECIALLRSFRYLAVAGNHDLAAVGALDTRDFNPAAALANQWTAGQLSDGERSFLANLPSTALEGDFTLVHGSLADPVWDYLVSSDIAEEHLALQSTPYGLVGHSHLPLLFGANGHTVRRLEAGEKVPLTDERFVANPGSLGQPRDGDPRAAYALLDLDERALTFHRIEYDIERTRAKMRAVGLPQSLIERLRWGR